jgi:hypothetical protein
MSEKEKILEKIKKCFALSKSANPHEAAVALKQAHALIKKHNIDNQIVDLCEMTSGNYLHAAKLKKLPVYLNKLLQIISSVFLVDAVIFSDRNVENKFNKTIKFYGHESDIMIAEYAWITLSKQLIQNRKSFINKYTDKQIKNATKTKRANIYAIGWVSGIYEEIKDLRRDISSEAMKEHFAAINNYISVVHDDLIEAKNKLNPAKNMTEQEYDAFIQGIKDGESVTIGKGVNSSIFKPNLLTN